MIGPFGKGRNRSWIAKLFVVNIIYYKMIDVSNFCREAADPVLARLRLSEPRATHGQS